MAKITGKNAYLIVEDSTGASQVVSPYLNAIVLKTSGDTADVTSFGAVTRERLSTLKDWSLDFTGFYSESEIDAVFAGILGGSTVIQFGPAGSDGGNVRYSASGVEISYKRDIAIGNAVGVGGTIVARSGSLTRDTWPSSLLTGLVSYWKLNESSGNAADSADSNTLTLAGGVTYGAGKLGNCAIMDGINSNLGIAADVANLSFTGDFTITCWVWNDADGTDPLAHVMVGKLSSYYQLEYWLTWEKYYGANFVRLYVAPSIGVTPTSVDSQDLSTGAWHFVRAWVGGGAAHIQVDDGTIYDSAAVTTYDGPYEFHVGSVMGTHDFFKGRLDEIAIYSRALTNDEGTEMYNGETGLTYPF